jgi:hypothetical protein
MTTLCTYVLTSDTGLAPNPYWGWCTLAVCTPNRQGAKLTQGDWIAGFSGGGDGNRLIYAMEVTERIDMDSYFHDPRFAAKKPNLRGTWQERCGDNFHSKNPDGTWQQHKNRFHDAGYLPKDTRRPHIFAAQRFWYFGSAKIAVPEKFHALIGTRGIRVNHDPSDVQAFLAWLASTQKPGIRALPMHNPDMNTARAVPVCAPPRRPIRSDQRSGC